MPCYSNCELRVLLLAKENKISKLRQVMRCVDALYRQEPHRRNETTLKKSVVNSQLDQAQAQAGARVSVLANGCNSCDAH